MPPPGSYVSERLEKRESAENRYFSFKLYAHMSMLPGGVMTPPYISCISNLDLHPGKA